VVLSSVRADTEPVDPKNYLEERCKPQCVKSLYDYEVCEHLS
jgi:ubiquinol-cytochrome c reductase subunit 6